MPVPIAIESLPLTVELKPIATEFSPLALDLDPIAVANLPLALESKLFVCSSFERSTPSLEWKNLIPCSFIFLIALKIPLRS